MIKEFLLLLEVIQDLFSLKYLNPTDLFKSKNIEYKKVHKYLTSENQYDDIIFKCLGKREQPKPVLILEYKITLDKFVEDCVSNNTAIRMNMIYYLVLL